MRVCRHTLVAWWLLLLLGRILTPEAAVLGLHGHAHTTVEPACLPAHKVSGKTFLTARHQHCAVEQFYNAPLQLAGTSLVLLPWYAPLYRRYAPLATVGSLFCAWRKAALRGPPAGLSLSVAYLG
ncbi:hypothetical protein H8B15_20095 [Hymenobacter sp. BT507]|uniref:Secreted protein n=1 Tax=Hymenobacter citatus TaxID=2763506 RepID=A0ABR7MQ75_9BACT|nr:hypothetical protein [Hymenobacter citatus]MBC6613234.1 hypothetical protein [Hymenobacter citatus]